MVMKPTAAKTAQLQSLLQRGFQALTRGQVREASDYCRQALGLVDVQGVRLRAESPSYF